MDLSAGRSVVVRINDRGPFAKGRVLDLSLAGAQALGMIGHGTDQIELRVVGFQGRAADMGFLRVQIGSFAEPQSPRNPKKLPPQPTDGNYGGARVRDRLCQIIRQHKLDPELVKAYAVDFCGTKTLREAAREQIENFVQELAAWAEKDRNALLCQLNSYARPKQEVVA